MEVKAKLLVVVTLFLTTGLAPDREQSAAHVFPYRQAGLTEKQAAAHLLSRFTFGTHPEETEQVVRTGLENWFREQLDGNLPDDSLASLLAPYPVLMLSNAEIAAKYPRTGQVIRMAVRDGFISEDSIASAGKREYRDEVAAYMKEKGYHSQKELLRQLISQKILRAACSRNQLREVLTDFWFNHFNVSVTKNQCAPFILAYERDVIRPQVTGKFGDILLATAQSPAMLYYLDNFSSASPLDEQSGTMERKVHTNTAEKARKNRGINENYAREIMELHTLGVDGGYTQQDVTEAARILTGWTVAPMDIYGIGQKAVRPGKQSAGAVRKGDFLFTPNRHDNKEKTVLGRKFRAGGGYEEGLTLLGILAGHPSTARFICKKLAIRFVSDAPPQALVDKMVKTFETTDGNIAAVLTTLAYAPEFWQKSILGGKTKSPFELAISTVRGLNAAIRAPYELYTWISRMGQNIYHFQAPTGFPDNARYWINTGALLNRMNFGLAISGDRMPGIRVDLARINQQREPESAAAAMHTYGSLIMPGRDLSPTFVRLAPLLNDPDLQRKVGEAAMRKDTSATGSRPSQMRQPANNMLAQVVGILIGSPEFQRR
nr:DUF1800 domain-containing protein [uncultured Dyadobacter sp.]